MAIFLLLSHLALLLGPPLSSKSATAPQVSFSFSPKPDATLVSSHLIGNLNGTKLSGLVPRGYGKKDCSTKVEDYVTESLEMHGHCWRCTTPISTTLWERQLLEAVKQPHLQLRCPQITFFPEHWLSCCTRVRHCLLSARQSLRINNFACQITHTVSSKG